MLAELAECQLWPASLETRVGVRWYSQLVHFYTVHPDTFWLIYPPKSNPLTLESHPCTDSHAWVDLTRHWQLNIALIVSPSKVSLDLLNFTLNSPRSKARRAPHSSSARFNGGRKKKKKNSRKIYNAALITSRLPPRRPAALPPLYLRFTSRLRWQEAAGNHERWEERAESSDEGSLQEEIPAVWGLLEVSDV